ncbi:MAG TPA: hypothetical protein VFB27_03030 [Opitutaceae bacterium]|nr:hypothetical protein [Opitutaceae bacterium]
MKTIHRITRLLFHFGLCLYPVDFRKRYATEITRVFEEGLADAVTAGLGPTLGYGAKTVADLCASALRERLRCVGPRDGLVVFVAVICGHLAVCIDFLATEVQATLLVLLLSGFLVGTVASRPGWRWALLIAVWLPLLHVALFAFALVHSGAVEGFSRHPYLSRLLLLLPALVASLVGLYLAVLMRFVGRRLAGQSRRQS